MPWTVLMSAGLMGAARARMRTVDAGIVGEMECLWMLQQGGQLLATGQCGWDAGTGSTDRRASFGSP